MFFSRNEGKTEKKKLRLQLKVAGKRGLHVINQCLPGRYFIVEGSITSNKVTSHSTVNGKAKKRYDLNAYKLYIISRN